MTTRIGWIGLGCLALIACGPPPASDVCKGRLVGDLVVTEVMLDPAGTDTGGEWFEIYNTLGTDVDLKGMVIFTRDTDGSGAKSHVVKAGTAKAQSYFTFGDIRSGPLPTWIGYTYADALGSFGNARGVVGIKCGATVFDEMTWTRAAKADQSRALNPTVPKTSTENDDETKWCDTPANAATTYSGTSAGTPGAANAACSQTIGNCTGRSVGDLVVTEIMLDPGGTDTGLEWFEIYNPLGTAIDLGGMEIFTRDTDGTGAKSHVIGQGTINAQSYFTLGDVRSGPLPAWIGYSYADALGSFGNARGVVGIKCGATVVDQATWSRVAKSDRSRMLDPTIAKTSAENDDEANWCDTQGGTVYSGTSAGTPGAENAVCLAEATTGTCVEDGGVRQIRAAGTGDLIITEIMANPKLAAATTGEWFEVLATKDVDLNDLTVATPTAATLLKRTECIAATAGEYVLFARSADSFINGSLPAPKLTYSLTLADTQSRLYLRRGDAGIDEAAYNNASNGSSWQLDSNQLNDVANNDPLNFCLASTQFNAAAGSDFGTPGASNQACPARPDAGTDGGVPDAGDPNSCFDIGAAAFRPIVKPVAGDFVVTEFMADPSAVTDAVGEWFEVLVKADADFNGLQMSGNSGLATVSSANCVRYDAGTLVLFANNANPTINGNIAPLVGTFGFALANTNAKIVLFTDAGTVDQVTWTSVSAGKSKQLDVNKQDSVQNDVLTNFCDGDGGIVLVDGGLGDKGTPGTANHACP